MMPMWCEIALSNRQQPTAALTFAEAFLSASSKERSGVVAEWDPTLDWALPNPWRLACVGEMPGTPRERILVALLFHALACPTLDTHDSIVGFAVIYNSCKLAGLDASIAFEELARALPGPPGEAVRAFAEREPETRSMEAFSLAVIETDGGCEISRR